MSVEDVDRLLGVVVGALDAASETIRAAALTCGESRDALAQAITGAGDADVLEALDGRSTTAEQLTDVVARVRATREQVEAYRRVALRPGTGTEDAPPPDRPAGRTRPPNAVGADGSEYPPDAAWAVPELPPRVRQFGDRTVAKLKIGDKPIPGSFSSGQDDVWSQEAAQRIKLLGVDVPDYLAHHVEVRAAAMMLRAAVRSAVVVLNNVPCGYQTPPPGCHQLLEAFLPVGVDVTVQGTDRRGRPYQRTYHGKAER